MSGSWAERAEAGLPLKPGDVASALKDLAVAYRAVQAALAEAGTRDAELVERLDKVEATLVDVVWRLSEAGPPKPAKAQGGKAAGGSS